MFVDAQLAAIVPIDLLIGGSPCNDLSLVNPNRRGFHFDGTGVLFFDFVRVLRDVTELNGKTHLFWMFENAASMKNSYRAVISRFLKVNLFFFFLLSMGRFVFLREYEYV